MPSCCPPSCVMPSCPTSCCSPCPPCGYPVGGLGKMSCCPSSCCPSSCCGTGTSACCLGVTSGANVSCLNQIPPSEVCIQPAPCHIVIPGPILAASCESLKVGGYTACAGCPPCGRMCPPC